MKKYKKILTSLICTAVTAASVCSLFIADAASNLNKTYRYYFDVIAGSGVSSMDAQFRYNFNETDVKKVYIGNLGGTHGFSVLDTGIDISYNKTPAPSSAGTLMVVSFDALNNVTNINDIVSVDITSVKNTNGSNISKSKVSCTSILVGDINMDGEFLSNDLLMLSKYLKGQISLSESQLKAADVDGSFGAPTQNDSDLLTNYLLGIANLPK